MSKVSDYSCVSDGYHKAVYTRCVDKQFKHKINQSSQDWASPVKTGQVNLDQFKLSQERLSQVGTGQIKVGKVKSDRLKNFLSGQFSS